MTFERRRIEDQGVFGEAEQVRIAGTAEVTVDLNATSQHTFYRRYGKRAFDVTLVLLCLPVYLPIIIILAALVSLDGAPAFFGHDRVGRGGKPFKCWKLRTMVPNAELLLGSYLDRNPAARTEWSANFKLTNDPRITRVGRFLRRTSLDELPQLLNVLKGEMSLVGPRPVTKDELFRYGAVLDIYLSLRPGITGIWQVSGRNSVTYRDRVLLDTAYSRKLSLRQDLGCLFGTIREVLRRTGV